MAGFELNKRIVNDRAGSLAVEGRNWFRAVDDFAAWLAAQDDAALTAIGYDVTGSDAPGLVIMKAAFIDLGNLSGVARAQRAQAEPNDFFFNARQLYGVS